MSSSSPFMDEYSSEDYSDHDDDYCFVPTATSAPQLVTLAQAETQSQSNELPNLMIAQQQEDVSTQSVYFDVLPELKAETAEEGGSGGIEQSIYLAVESYFVLEAQAETVGVAAAAALEAESTMVEELTVESCFDLEAQAETGLPSSALERQTVLEEGDVIESESLETVEADTAVETVERMIEEFNFEAVESESDLEAEDAIEEPNSDVEHEADAVAPEAETAVEEGDVIGESNFEAVESDYDLEAEAEDMVDEQSDSCEEEWDSDAEDSSESYFGPEYSDSSDSLTESSESDMDSDMESSDSKRTEEEHDVVDEPLDLDTNLQAEAEARVEEGAAMEESIYEPVESNSDLQAEDPEVLAEPAVSIEKTTDLEPEELEDLIDEQSDSCEEEWDSDAEDSSESYFGPEYSDSSDSLTESSESDMDSDMESSDSKRTEEEHDVVDEPLDLDTNLQAEAEARVEEGAAMEESIYELVESNSDLQAEDPEVLAEPAVSIEKTTDLEPEELEDLIDEQSDSCEEEWDSDAEDSSESYFGPESSDSDMESSYSKRTEEEEDDVVPASALAWAKLPVTDDTTTLEDSSLQESFLGWSPMLVLKECGNAMTDVIETLLFELLLIRNALRRVLGSLFRKRETTKHA